ncbi:GTPase ObgE [Abyssisolibacter fermentans]|uniref:GTPase ObgE n=1 Tax=Abyssisolibacter fermentans TaxID=1766203 RepID=UPI0008332C37|nr:GTPase ObgE [Abyssisolibacter fermentans]
MFIDKAKIFVKGGNGGHGAVAWRREKFEPSGGPAGGDGGYGGNVILQVDEGLRTLMDFRYKRKYCAQNGDNGRKKYQFGKKGMDLIIKIPAGTIVRDELTNKVIADMTENDQTFVIAKGGRGGKGNAKFATATRQAPGFAEGGTKGEERNIILELKLLADIGLIGFPNVGKSTILSIMSDAKPKIANYHFTTLKPNLGMVRIGENKSFVMADIPGLIEGAHKGIGLGHEFLRHIERTKILVHMIDVSGHEGRNPIEDFYKINEELKEYNSLLLERPQIVVANKMDIPGAEEGYTALKEELEPKGYVVMKLSAATRKGVEELKFKIWEELKNAPDLEPIIKVEEVTFENPTKEDYVVKAQDGKFIVEGNFVQKLLDSTNFDDMDSIRYFQKRLREKGIIEELEKLGVKEEDVVDICGYEFEFFF